MAVNEEKSRKLTYLIITLIFRKEKYKPKKYKHSKTKDETL